MLPGIQEINPGAADFGYMTLNGAGSVIDMSVLGSVGDPQWFEFRFKTGSGYKHYKLLEAVFSSSGGKLEYPEGFIGDSAPLVNGLEVGFIEYNQSIEVNTPVFTLYSNFDIIAYSTDSKPWGFDSTTQNVVMAEFFKDYSLVFDPKAIRGIYAIVRDDLSDFDQTRFSVRGHLT